MAFFVPETHDFGQQSSIGLAAPKKDPEMKASSSDRIKEGKDVIITVTFPSDATGTCYAVINGVSFDPIPLINGKTKLFISDLPIDIYTPTVYYSGDEQYLAKSVKSNTFRVY